MHWFTSTLVWFVRNGEKDERLWDEVLEEREISSEGTPVRSCPLPAFLKYDTSRFRMAAWRNLIAVVDAFGEVFLFEHTGKLVCAFFVFRTRIAAWMPDGTCMGPAALLGRPETPEAMKHIGQALLQAWQRGEGVAS